MSPELRKRIEKAQKENCWQNVSLDFIYESGFYNGAEWMHDNELVPRDELIMQMKDCLEQCEDQGFVMPGEYDKVIELIKEWKGGEG